MHATKETHLHYRRWVVVDSRAAVVPLAKGFTDISHARWMAWVLPVTSPAHDWLHFRWQNGPTPTPLQRHHTYAETGSWKQSAVNDTVFHGAGLCCWWNMQMACIAFLQNCNTTGAILIVMKLFGKWNYFSVHPQSPLWVYLEKYRLL